MGKICLCGSPMCPICNRQVKEMDKRAGVNANIPVPPPQSANIPVTARRTPVRVTVEEEGAIAVDCACGCGEKVWLKPAYYSSACRSRAWRKKKAE